jgi:hypothetical protein
MVFQEGGGWAQVTRDRKDEQEAMRMVCPERAVISLRGTLPGRHGVDMRGLSRDERRDAERFQDPPSREGFAP